MGPEQLHGPGEDSFFSCFTLALSLACLHYQGDRCCCNRCSGCQFSGSSEDGSVLNQLNRRQSALWSTQVLQFPEKSKGSRPESISHRHSTVKTPGLIDYSNLWRIPVLFYKEKYFEVSDSSPYPSVSRGFISHPKISNALTPKFLPTQRKKNNDIHGEQRPNLQSLICNGAMALILFTGPPVLPPQTPGSDSSYSVQKPFLYGPAWP
ncbi:hypothetical protein UY3_11287 [Chelonia mydas]|uniref:Uncharacterized protein n=1 Tax=Chelonia mydas TaxID=8469 RepID=M7B137_CHEMY|nr:hypothetical protein UY3_11287 [Chelonia mydas]